MKLKKGSPDFLIFLTVLLLLSIGIVMVFSASQYVAFYQYKDSFYFLRRQIFNAWWELVP